LRHSACSFLEEKITANNWLDLFFLFYIWRKIIYIFNKQKLC